MFSTKTIADMDDLQHLQCQWQNLTKKDAKATLFNSYGWVESWIKHYWNAGYRLNVVTVEFNEQLVAILPLYIQVKNKTLFFLATGEPEEGEITSEYLDFIVDDSFVKKTELYSFIAAFLARLPISSIEFMNCVCNSHVYPITALMQGVLRETTGYKYQLNLADIPGSETVGSSARQKKNNRQLVNRYKKIDELSADFLCEDNYRENWAILKKLHQQDWEARGKPGALASNEFNSFHCYMHETYPEIPQLFSTLSYKDEIISIHHYYQYKNILYFYLTGTVKENHSRLSPGMMLHVVFISSMNGKNVYYDFMKAGGKGSYKEKFCIKGDEFYSITIHRADLIGTFRNLKNKLRRIKANFNPTS